ncbi:MAG: cyoA [Verrucomicrobiales bacterium]|nr:cyoA [Verrucomicrobiales bacterium]
MGFLNKLFGIIDNGSEHGSMVDHMLEIVHWFMAVLFVGWSIYLVIAVWKGYHKRTPKANYHGIQSHASSHIEIGVIITEIILLMGFAFPLWANRVDQFPDPDVKIKALAEQFAWNFQYAGADGKLGATDRFLISSQNPAGIDPEDPNGWDDFISGSLTLPRGKKVEINVTSKDVIHNLALPVMRIAQDADPGKESRMWFIPTKVGKSEIICGQLCGPAHANMRSVLEIVPDDKTFATWMGEQNVFGDSAAAQEVKKKLQASGRLPVTLTPAPAAAPAPAVPATPAPAPAPAATQVPAPAQVAPAPTVPEPAPTAAPGVPTAAPVPAAPAAQNPSAPTAAPAPAPAVPEPAPTAAPGAPTAAPVPAAPAAQNPPSPTAAATPAPESSDEAKIELGVIAAVMKFDKPTLTVKPGQKVTLLFKNARCPLQHNFLLVKPGKLSEVGGLADKMLTDPRRWPSTIFPPARKSSPTAASWSASVRVI